MRGARVALAPAHFVMRSMAGLLPVSPPHDARENALRVSYRLEYDELRSSPHAIARFYLMNMGMHYARRDAGR